MKNSTREIHVTSQREVAIFVWGDEIRYPSECKGLQFLEA
jgi:hypothetical protein